MEAPKKQTTDKLLDSVEEPVTAFEKPAAYSSEEEEMHPVLVQLLEKALKESEQGLGRPHEEVWAELKAKHNFK
jgi:hypothetical protein